MHGRSANVSKAGEESTFTWAARMHFRRDEEGKVLIDKYTIIVVCCFSHLQSVWLWIWILISLCRIRIQRCCHK
jgi:hypothetical protein